MSALSSATITRAPKVAAKRGSAEAQPPAWMRPGSPLPTGSGAGSQRNASSTKARAPVVVAAPVMVALTPVVVATAATGSGADPPDRADDAGGRPSGSSTRNSEPSPCTLEASIRPPCSLTSSCTSARPMPEPSWVRPSAPATRWKRSKTRGSSSAGMPAPVSAISSTASRGSWPWPRRRTVTCPRKVNLKALDSRFRTIFSHISRSTQAAWSSGAQSTSKASPARSMAERKVLARSRVSAARSVASKRASARPASIREKSSSVFTRRCRRDALRSTRARRSRWGPLRSGAVTRSSSGPSISVSGVRNSWLMLEKKTVLARSSWASSSARRRSAS